MSISVTTVEITYDGNAVASQYTYPFRIDNKSTIEVYVSAVLKTEGTDYTVSGVGSTTGGTVSFVASLVPGSGVGNVKMFRNSDPVHRIDYSEGGALPIANAEASWDRLAMVLQEHRDYIDNRAIFIPRTHSASTWDGSLADPGAASMVGASKLMVFRASGIVLANVSVTSVDAINTQGEIVVHNTSTALALSIGSNGAVLHVDTTASTLVAWGSGAVSLGQIPYYTGSIVGYTSAVASSNEILLFSGVPTWGYPNWVQPFNHMTNPEQGIWQEHTIFSITTASRYTSDQTAVVLSGGEYLASVSRAARSDDAANVPTVAQAGRVIPFSHLLTTSLEETALGASDFLTLCHPLVANVTNDLAGNAITFSTWLKSSLVGTYCLFLTNSASTYRSYVKTFTIDVADTWEHKVFHVVMDDQSLGTWQNTVGLGLVVGITLSSGSDFDGVDGTWETAQDKSTASCTNTFMTTASMTFYHTGLVLVQGTTDGTVARSQAATELVQAAQYFQNKSYNTGTNVATSTLEGNHTWVGPTTNSRITIDHPVSMRITPHTVTYYSPNTGAASAFFNLSAGADGDITAITTGYGQRSVIVTAQGTGADNFKKIHYWSDARFSLSLME